jgi:hypothetical protein
VTGPGRKYTNKLYEVMSERGIDAFDVAVMALNYMSEDDVEDMCRANGIDLFPEEDEETDE